MNIIKGRKIVIIAIGLLLAIIILIGSYAFLYHQLMIPASTDLAEQTFVIEKDSGLKKIANDLKEANLIKSRFAFIFYIYYRGWAAHLQAGEYSLSPSLNSIQIAYRIVGGDIVLNEVLVTIPEGFNLKQIDARLADAGLIKKGDLLAQAEGLEGYLFPDTYRFDKYENLDNIILKMRSNFDIKVNDELMAEIEKQEKSLGEIVTMASILEREVRSYTDKRIASGIFWKRINNNYPLQSCATLAYILGEDKWKYSIADTKVESPYNTYQNIGLPPGPICSPGLDAIKAAIYPKMTDYNFFLSKPGTGETIFSRTGEEHNINKAKYLQ